MKNLLVLFSVFCLSLSSFGKAEKKKTLCDFDNRGELVHQLKRLHSDYSSIQYDLYKQQVDSKYLLSLADLKKLNGHKGYSYVEKLIERFEKEPELLKLIETADQPNSPADEHLSTKDIEQALAQVAYGPKECRVETCEEIGTCEDSGLMYKATQKTKWNFKAYTTCTLYCQPNEKPRTENPDCTKDGEKIKRKISCQLMGFMPYVNRGSSDNGRSNEGYSGYGGGGTRCFMAGTLIKTPSGSKAIENIQVGDSVVSYDLESHKLVTTQVKATVKNPPRPVGQIKLATGKTLRLTDSHPIYDLKNKTWKEAREIDSGFLMFSASGPVSTLSGFESKGEVETTYNLSVDSPHNYFAEEILVHNKNMAPSKEASQGHK